MILAMTRFIGFASGKGGVGQTTLTTNIATALHLFGQDVVLLDADLDAPHVSLLLDAHTVDKTIHHALKNVHHIRDVAYRHKSGLRFIAGSIFEDMQEGLDSSDFDHMMNDVIGTCELVCVDMPHAGPRYKDIMTTMTDIVVIVTPDMLSVTEALKVVKSARAHKKNLAGVIVNRIGSHEHNLSSSAISSMLDIAVIGEVHETSEIHESLRAKQPFLVRWPAHDTTEHIKSIAATLIGESYIVAPKTDEKKKKSLFSWGSKKD